MTTELFSCRSCGSSDIAPILDLGETPLANSLLKTQALSAQEPRFPLDLVMCKKCALVQITVSVPPAQLFSEYLYFSSFSDTMLSHAETIATRILNERKLGSDSLVAEIASNDGYLLQYYAKESVPVLGIEPATNIAKVAEERGVRTVNDFFSLNLATSLAADGLKADVIHANNVMAHVPDINGVAAGIAAMLKDDGVFISESPYVKDMIDHVEFDTIYHEHLCYYSATSQDRLYARHGLQIYDIERLPIHGGSIRIFVRKNTGQPRSPGADKIFAEEKAWGVDDPSFYAGFGARVDSLRSELVHLLTELKGQGKKIAAYGASAKGSTLLNFFGVGWDVLDFVADRSTIKQGLFTPGTHLPIVAPEKLVEDRPDYVLLLTWNFVDEILRQQAEYRALGGKFIVPIPSVRIV